MTDPVPTEEVEKYARRWDTPTYDVSFRLADDLLAARKRIAELEAAAVRDEREFVWLRKVDYRGFVDRLAKLEVAVRELGRCRTCGGDGKQCGACAADPIVHFCSPTRRIHDCPGCTGTGWHPAAQPFVK